MASSSGVSATSQLGPAGSNSTMVLTSTTPGTGSVLSLPVGKHCSITGHVYLCVCVCMLVSVSLIRFSSHNLNRSFRLQIEFTFCIACNVVSYSTFKHPVFFHLYINLGYGYRCEQKGKLPACIIKHTKVILQYQQNKSEEQMWEKILSYTRPALPKLYSTEPWDSTRKF
jgi:hypothetical protein